MTAGSVDRSSLVAYLGDYLDSEAGRDACPNGLQVEGRATVRKLVTGVSACRELFVRAREAGADAVLVHHGLFWRGDPPVLTGVLYARVAELVRSGISLLAYHLPLDRHPEVGNNAQAARAFGLIEQEPFGRFDGEALGVKGRLAAPMPVEAFRARCREVFGQEPQLFPHGPDPLLSVALVSGAAERAFHEAIAEGLDLFLTGEVSEWVVNLARESATHFVAAGHYATERLGVQALGRHLAERFGIAVEFIDVPNPV